MHYSCLYKVTAGVLLASSVMFISCTGEAKPSKKDLAKAQQFYTDGLKSMQKGAMKDAAGSFMEADKLAEDDALYELLAGDCLKEMNQYPSSIRYYEEALSHVGKTRKELKDKIRQKAYMGLARSYTGANDEENAVRYADKAIHEFPKDYRGHYMKGLVFVGKDEDVAIREFNASLDIDKTQYGSYSQLIKIYMAKNDTASLMRLYEQAVDYRPLDEDMKLSLAKLYIGEGQKAGSDGKVYYDKAIEVMKSLVSVNDKNAFAHYYLATAYIYEGLQDAAYEELNNTEVLNKNLGQRLRRELDSYSTQNTVSPSANNIVDNVSADS